MDILITNELLNSLMISITLSVIVMSCIQKIKLLSYIKKENQIFFLNLILSFGLGIPYSKIFYDLNIKYSFWISLFSFIGAPTIYKTLQKQNIINYTPKSLNEVQKNKQNDV